MTATRKSIRMILFAVAARAWCFWAGPAAGAPPASGPGPGAQTQPQQPAAASIGPLSLQNASIVEVIDQLAKQLHINYSLDPRVKGGVYLNTYGETRNMDPRNLLEMILRISGFGMVQEGDIYRILPLSDLAKQPIRIQQVLTSQGIPDDDQIMLNLVFLKYVTVDELSSILLKFTDATITTYAPANLLFILDSHRNMRRTMDLIAQFDSDMFVNQRVHLFELKNAKPSDLQKDLENIMKSISLDPKNSTVKFLAVDRISTLIAVAPNPGVFDTIESFIKKLDLPVTVAAGDVDLYFYHVKYGRSDCLAMALNQVYGNPTGGSGYGGSYGGGGAYGAPGGAYAAPYGGGGGYGGRCIRRGRRVRRRSTVCGTGGYGGTSGGAYGAANNFASGFGGAGACGQGSSGGGDGLRRAGGIRWIFGPDAADGRGAGRRGPGRLPPRRPVRRSGGNRRGPAHRGQSARQLAHDFGRSAALPKHPENPEGTRRAAPPDPARGQDLRGRPGGRFFQRPFVGSTAAEPKHRSPRGRLSGPAMARVSTSLSAPWWTMRVNCWRRST